MPSIINATLSNGLVTSADNSGSLQLATNNGTTAVTIDTSQNVGIGSASPVAKLEISAANAVLASAGIAQVGATTAGADVGGQITFRNTDARRAAIAGRQEGGDAIAGYLQFGTRGTSGDVTERMRVSSTGQLLVGITSIAEGHYLGGDFSNKWTLFVQNTNASLPNGILVNYNNTAPNNTARDFFYATDSAAQRMSVRSNGGIANYSGNNVNLSDAREKTNVELAGSYLDKICAIPVKTFNYIDQNRDEDDGLTLGVIAQDVQEIAPELVSESNWAGKDEPEKMRLSIYQTDLQYALMKCIQEQQAIITDLKARIETLEAK